MNKRHQSFNEQQAPLAEVVGGLVTMLANVKTIFTSIETIDATPVR